MREADGLPGGHQPPRARRHLAQPRCVAVLPACARAAERASARLQGLANSLKMAADHTCASFHSFTTARRTEQVREVPADDVIRERAHERQVAAAAARGQLEAAKAHEGARDAADHRAGLHLYVAAGGRGCADVRRVLRCCVHGYGPPGTPAGAFQHVCQRRGRPPCRADITLPLEVHNYPGVRNSQTCS